MTATQALIDLDVSDLQASCEFYARTLGFSVVATSRPGLIFEQRTLVSPRWPALGLRLRAGFGKRPTGSSPGSYMGLTLAVPSLPAEIDRLKSAVRWTHGIPTPVAPANPGSAAPSPHAAPLPAQFVDPDHYLITLIQAAD